MRRMPTNEQVDELQKIIESGGGGGGPSEFYKHSIWLTFDDNGLVSQNIGINFCYQFYSKSAEPLTDYLDAIGHMFRKYDDYEHGQYVYVDQIINGFASGTIYKSSNWVKYSWPIMRVKGSNLVINPISGRQSIIIYVYPAIGNKASSSLKVYKAGTTEAAVATTIYVEDVIEKQKNDGSYEFIDQKTTTHTNVPVEYDISYTNNYEL